MENQDDEEIKKDKWMKTMMKTEGRMEMKWTDVSHDR